MRRHLCIIVCSCVFLLKRKINEHTLFESELFKGAERERERERESTIPVNSSMMASFFGTGMLTPSCIIICILRGAHIHDATGKSRPGICIATEAIAVSGRKRGDSSDGDASSMRSESPLLLWTLNEEGERERSHGGPTQWQQHGRANRWEAPPGRQPLSPLSPDQA